jgi:hypothetical protein
MGIDCSWTGIILSLFSITHTGWVDLGLKVECANGSTFDSAGCWKIQHLSYSSRLYSHCADIRINDLPWIQFFRLHRTGYDIGGPSLFGHLPVRNERSPGYHSSDHHIRAVLTHRHRKADEVDPVLNLPIYLSTFVSLRNFLARKLHIIPTFKQLLNTNSLQINKCFIHK